jgi:uncharacterized oxidoreductase
MFRPVAEFRQQSEQFCALLAASAPSGEDRVLVPGEIEAATRLERTRDGIPLADATWQDLAGLPGGPTDSPPAPAQGGSR